jgi:hypothetical protein
MIKVSASQSWNRIRSNKAANSLDKLGMSKAGAESGPSALWTIHPIHGVLLNAACTKIQRISQAAFGCNCFGQLQWWITRSDYSLLFKCFCQLTLSFDTSLTSQYYLKDKSGYLCPIMSCFLDIAVSGCSCFNILYRRGILCSYGLPLH